MLIVPVRDPPTKMCPENLESKEVLQKYAWLNDGKIKNGWVVLKKHTIAETKWGGANWRVFFYLFLRQNPTKSGVTFSGFSAMFPPYLRCCLQNFIIFFLFGLC